MIKIHVHLNLLKEFEQYKQIAVYCIPKGKNKHGVNFDLKFNHRTVAEELRFCKKFKEFLTKNKEEWEKTFENK